MKAVNSFLPTQRWVTLKDLCGYIMSGSFISHICRMLLSWYGGYN